ncbi:hypothetical protein K2173_019184 [Erythroxylum novogranatense]|uniref:F-box/LRR-repeat protein 15-like leucin rich repeat domain-containing protein n=1 Tax=Erythroxylum novogranatense TaxID=1862640 RepID=A0AAV8STR1_9ROSI|nr:hypothetical protein K2173_019184 [Erythroxylum novogranatense]
MEQGNNNNKPAHLPEECWELIFKSLDHHRHLEPLSLVSTRFLSITNLLRRTLTVSSLSAPFLHRIIPRFPNLTHIKVCDFYGDLDSVLDLISLYGLDIESLDISGQSHFPLVGLRRLGSKVRNLKRLNCSKMGSLRDSDLSEIGSLFPMLEELDIGFPMYNSRFNPTGSLSFERFAGVVTDEGMLDLSSKIKKLRKIDVSGNHFITDRSLLALSLNCGLLSEVVIRDCDFISQNGIGMAMRSISGLSSISLDGIGIPSIDSCFEASFAYAKCLSELDLSNSIISDELLGLVAESCLPLNKLTISHCYDFSFAGVSCLLHKYQSLGYLDLEGANFLTDESIVELSNYLCNLSFINLSLCSRLTSSTFFTLMENCHSLEDLRLERTNLGVEHIVKYSTNRRVKSLSLTGNNNLSDECIKDIALSCPGLEVLKISYCPSITEEGIKEVIRNCREIIHLEMNRCIGIKNTDLNFELPKLEILQAQGTGMDDEALAAISKKCPGLLQLDLEGCLNVTTKGVTQLVQNCRRLREISLKWCDNVKVDIIYFLVSSRLSLRKIIPPCGFSPSHNQVIFFLRHGCLLYQG